MTREEAINILSRPITMKNTPSDILEAHKIAIEALKRESCSDTIGRQAVSEAINRIGFSKSNPNEIHVAVECLRAVEALPTIIPQPKMGRWIRVDKNKLRCSECGVIHLIAQYPVGKIDWCPNCGAKMQEKSEDENDR